MSSYMVDDATVNAIAAWAHDTGWRPENIGPGATKGEQWDHAQGREDRRGEMLQQTIGRVLLLANACGQRDRYGDDELARAAEYSYNYRHCPNPVHILKVCQCFDYQACEWRGYHGSLAEAIVRWVRNAAITKLPGYDDAPWGLHDHDAPTAEPVSTLRDAAPFRLSLVR